MFAKRLKEERMNKNLSQEDLAKRVGVSRVIISYWESGKRNMTLENAHKVFRELGVSVTIGKNSDSVD